jgi:site-specific DNA-adenine methylase
MDMKPNLVLIQTSSKFCVKITGTEEGLQNPKNWSQDQTGGSIKDKTKKTKQNKTKQKTKTKQNKKKKSYNQDQRFILKSRTGQHGCTPLHRKGKLAVDSGQPSSQVLLKRTIHKVQGNEEALHHTSFGCHQRFFIFLTPENVQNGPP